MLSSHSYEKLFRTIICSSILVFNSNVYLFFFMCVLSYKAVVVVLISFYLTNVQDSQKKSRMCKGSFNFYFLINSSLKSCCCISCITNNVFVFNVHVRMSLYVVSLCTCMCVCRRVFVCLWYSVACQVSACVIHVLYIWCKRLKLGYANRLHPAFFHLHCLETLARVCSE